MSAHDALLADAVTSRAGRIVKSTGDGVMAVFSDAAQAMAAAVAVQQDLVRSNLGVVLRVRVGIHCGEAEFRDGDWFGTPVNTAARVTDCGHGGQILVTGAALATIDRTDLVVDLRDLGHHVLKDVEGEVHLYQVVAEGLAAAFPSLRTGRRTPNNLPAPPTRLIGRGAQLRAVHDALDNGTRILSLLGPGGIGKTRLSVQVGLDCLGRFPDGVWFIDLAPRRGRGVVLDAIRASLGLSDRGGEDSLTALSSHLKPQRALLILDNFEQATDDAVDVAELLAACPGLTALATTRIPLRIRGERIVNVPPLSVPDVGDQSDASAVMAHEAVQLFVERARDVAELDLDDRGLRDTAAVVRLVEGIPLAIEIAASRLLDLPLGQLRSQLTSRLDTLADGPRDLPARHQTLRATIAWSWELLAEVDQMVMRRLSVLPGGVTVESAAAVTETEAVEAQAALERLTAASLLTPAWGEAGARWVALESVREFAGEQLEASGEAERARDLTAGWAVAVGAEAQAWMSGERQGEAVRRLTSEMENLKESLRHLITQASPSAVALAESIARWWILQGQLREGIEWLERVVDSATPDTPKFRPALTALAALAGTAGDHEKAGAAARRAAELSREAGDETHEVVALNILGANATIAGDLVEAEGMFRRCIELLSSKGRSFTLASASNNLGLVFTRTKRFEEAIAAHTEALRVFEELDDATGQANSLKFLGTAYRELDRWEEAEEAYVRAIKLSELAGNRQGLAEILGNLALVRSSLGDPDNARTLLEEAWSRAVEAGSPRGRATVCNRRSTIELSLGNRVEAARQLHLAADLLEEAGSVDAISTRERARKLEAGN